MGGEVRLGHRGVVWLGLGLKGARTVVEAKDLLRGRQRELGKRVANPVEIELLDGVSPDKSSQYAASAGQVRGQLSGSLRLGCMPLTMPMNGG